LAADGAGMTPKSLALPVPPRPPRRGLTVDCERRRDSATVGGGRRAAEMGDTLGLTRYHLPTMEADRPSIEGRRSEATAG